MRYLRLATLLVILVLPGCFTGRMNKVMQSWEGQHFSDLVMSWGPPHDLYNDGAGGRILVYYESRLRTTPGRAVTYTRNSSITVLGVPQSITLWVPPETRGYVAWRLFRVNRNGRIYSWSWRGL
jgi:hypothetical protein